MQRTCEGVRGIRPQVTFDVRSNSPFCFKGENNSIWKESLAIYQSRVVAKKFVCRLTEKLSRLKNARSAFCRRHRYGRESPPPIRGLGGPPQEILKFLIQFGALW